MTFFRLELDGDLDHINRLDDTGGKHAAEPADDEGVDGVEELVS